jgi:hypothetical protein
MQRSGPEACHDVCEVPVKEDHQLACRRLVLVASDTVACHSQVCRSEWQRSSGMRSNSEVEADVALAALGTTQLNSSRWADRKPAFPGGHPLTPDRPMPDAWRCSSGVGPTFCALTAGSGKQDGLSVLRSSGYGGVTLAPGAMPQAALGQRRCHPSVQLLSRTQDAAHPEVDELL